MGPAPTAASSAPKRVPPYPRLGWMHNMIPTPVRSVPDRTVGAYWLPTSMRTGWDGYSGCRVTPVRKISRSPETQPDNDVEATGN